MDRTILEVTGGDREAFLQNLVTNDVGRARGALAYAALLTPQGKLMADMLVAGEADRLLLDAPAAVAPLLLQRLGMYRLRADVGIALMDLRVRRGTGPAPAGALADPRDAALGWRLYGAEGGDDGTDWDRLRVDRMVPEWGAELGPETYILEAGFERLHGVDFRKGCYVGQEVTARMKHKTELRKGLARVELEGAAPPGTPLLDAEGREAGVLWTQGGGRGLAHLRFDRAEGPMTAGAARARWDGARG